MEIIGELIVCAGARTSCITQIALTEARLDRWGRGYPLMSHLALAFEPASKRHYIKPAYSKSHQVLLVRSTVFLLKNDGALPGSF